MGINDEFAKRILTIIWIYFIIAFIRSLWTNDTIFRNLEYSTLVSLYLTNIVYYIQIYIYINANKSVKKKDEHITKYFKRC